MSRIWNGGCTLLWTLLAGSLLAVPAFGQDAGELSPGATMPMADDALSNVKGGQATLTELGGERGTLVVFWSNQCPWVERYEARLLDVAEAFSDQGISFVLVNSNDADAYPQEAASESASRYDEMGYPSNVAYLADPSSELARAFGAERTPHLFLFDADRVLLYAGAIDDSPGDPDNVEERYLRNALDAVVGGSDVAVPQSKAFGCTIKFKG